jgi:hypothetical protein
MADDSLFRHWWKRFLRSLDDAAKSVGASAEKLFWGIIVLSVTAECFGLLYGPEEGYKKFVYGAIAFVVLWAVTVIYMLFRFLFVTPHKMHTETRQKYEKELAAKNTEIQRLQAESAVTPQDRMRFDKLKDYIAELEVIKENIENREQKGIQQFNNVNDACADFIATAFPEFHDYPPKPRPQDVQSMRRNETDFINYEAKCENALNALYKLRNYYPQFAK